jgi:hypothetical protein
MTEKQATRLATKIIDAVRENDKTGFHFKKLVDDLKLMSMAHNEDGE